MQFHLLSFEGPDEYERPFSEFLRSGRVPSAFRERCWWASRHAIGSVYIDLEEDDYQEIARKLEQWTHVEE
jgi:hypothetical protein